MLKSMTAFGRAAKRTRLGVFSVEIQSVNRKHLDLSVNLPVSFSRFETEIRKVVGNHVVRGNVSVKMGFVSDNELPVAIKPNLALWKQYKEAWELVSKELSIPFNPQAFFTSFANETALFFIEDTTEKIPDYSAAIHEVLEEALNNFIKMKLEEGKALQEDILSRWHKLRSLITEINKKSPDAVVRYRQKLSERLKELLSGGIEQDERLLKEIALYAERIDVSEEITRFDSHLNQFSDLIHSPSESVGKTLEFILQELNREINTIASKSADIEISRWVIEAKSELEKIREQIQNVE